MDRLDAAYRTLRLTYGLVPLLAGLDKFFNVLADWPSYISPIVAALLPIAPATAMRAVGIVEMAVGVLVLARWTRLGAYLAMGWLVAIAANLVLAGRIDIAVRDLAMAAGAFTLARFAEARGEATVAIPAVLARSGAR